VKIQDSKFSPRRVARGDKVQNARLACVLVVCCLMVAVTGCGYTVRSKASLPFKAVRIGKIVNKTLEPKLQDRLYTALTEEFLKQGVDVDPTARYEISGQVKQFALRILSEKSNIASEYEVIIKADFRLVDPSGKVRNFRNIGSPFIVTFSGAGSLNKLTASKELASEQAIKDMASEIVATLIYQ
jgi:outer membrane lipopolysaccharide assembly protein LptE/RlpB